MIWNLCFICTFIVSQITTTIFATRSQTFSLVGVNQKPSQPPYKVISRGLVNVKNQCTSRCLHEDCCWSFLVDTTNLQCLLYNTTLHFVGTLTESPGNKYYSVMFPIFTDCVDWYSAGARESGVYPITLPTGSVSVRCYMEIEGGGWLVFQRRFNGSVDFHRTFEEYKQGFGSVHGEFYLGNELLHQLTSRTQHDFYLKAESFGGETEFSKYSNFHVDSAVTFYKLNTPVLISGVVALSNSAGMMFSTKDKDKDTHSEKCVSEYARRGGFWYSDCGDVHPNAEYYHTKNITVWKGIYWNKWLGAGTALKKISMMIRRTNL